MKFKKLSAKSDTVCPACGEKLSIIHITFEDKTTEVRHWCVKEKLMWWSYNGTMLRARVSEFLYRDETGKKKKKKK